MSKFYRGDLRNEDGSSITLEDLGKRWSFEIREAKVAVDPDRPFLMSDNGPLWFHKINSKTLQLQDEYGALARRELINQMVWGKAISKNQTPQNFRSLNGSPPAALMIGLYEQMYGTSPAGAFAKIPDGDSGSVFLLRSGSMFSVFADSIGAAKRFCLGVIERTNFKEAVVAEGIGLNLYNELIKQLTP